MPRNPNCNHEDWPCCGCGDEPSQEEQMEQAEEMEALSGVNDLDEEDQDPADRPEDNFRDDVEADADVLRMAGFGTDEDYGHYGDDTPMGDAYGGE